VELSAQLLAIRVAEAKGALAADLFGEEYLTDRPLVAGDPSRGTRPAVLLIDEIDRRRRVRVFLFELLAESSVTIPELGTVTAVMPPVVVLTSNRTRDLHDALKRRCLYHWIDYPTLDRAVEIIRRRVPASTTTLAAEVAAAVQRLRSLDLQKPPGIAEAINWTMALELLGIPALDEAGVGATLGSVLKYREDATNAQERGLAWVASG
jgi:MoxR-like ATPase